uniref:C2H2-type domain-containing protein n=1 Tax=Electrophorus electricus TaxID=8005 RepID=A0A4W4EXF1_ELEEL
METQSQVSSAAEKKKRVETIVATKSSSTRTDISEKAVASSTTSNEDDTAGSPYHRERRNAISGQAAGLGLVASKLSEEPSTSTEERPSLVKKELHASLPHLADHTLPYRGTLFTMDPRNGYLDPHYTPAQFFPGFHPPVPIDDRHTQGRYIYEPSPVPPLHVPPALAGSPAFSDISVIRIPPHRNPSVAAESPFNPPHPYINPYMDYIRSLHSSPPLSMISAARGLSPADAPHTGLATVEYYHQMALLAGHRNPYADFIPSAVSSTGAGGNALHMDYLQALEGSRFPSPRLLARQSRKRPLPVSPHSDSSFDLQVIRNSPNSLVTILNSSRPSTSTSGSYGHLSVGAVSPALSFAYPPTPVALQMHQQLIGRPPGIVGSAFGHSPPLIHPGPAFATQRPVAGIPSSGPVAPERSTGSTDSQNKPTSESAVSSTGDPMHHKRSKMKPDEEPPSPGAVSVQTQPDGMTLVKEEGEKEEGKQEPEVVYETNCHWENCCREFDTQEQLVHHINNDHIHGEKKEFVCRWEECSREQKPFKAQYMLVVHMRRHTGEKPHKCTFEGCSKAYSRLENLKTHLPVVLTASCTLCPQKPYVCKIPGCTKRYTDPSSLRKHVKTVHGPEAHVTKKQRGDAYPRPPPPRDPGSFGDQREYNHATSKQDDCLQVKSIKTEKPMTSQPSPGGQSSCSSDQPPAGPHLGRGVQLAVRSVGLVGEALVVEDQEDEEEDEGEGEEEDTPIMDCTVSTATAPACALTLRTRRGLGRPLRWMEQVKMERLRQVNGSVPRLGHLSPTLPPTGQVLPVLTGKGPCPGRSSCGGIPAAQPSPRSELSCTELTVLSLLRDRRDSGVSAASSAYLSGSRRSSGVSPCFSSRRSSQASQFEPGQPGRLHSLSTADSYDPISTDASRRSSEASQGGSAGGGGSGGVVAPGAGWGGGSGGVGGGGTGLRSVLSLTPAQHYHLKAKYAAATGGRPPTPLPSMEQGRPRSHVARDGQDTTQLTLPPLVRPRRCSDGSTNTHSSHTGYRRRGFYPGEGPGNGDRRASDPIWTRDHSSFGLPHIQRFSSLNNMHPLPPLVGNHYPFGESNNLSLQNCTRSEGNLQRGLLFPCPPSIMEQSALESLAMEHDEALLFREEDILPEDLVQYLHSQEHETICGQQNGTSSHPHRNSQVPEEAQSFHNPPEQQRAPEAQSPSENGMPIQWNEVSSGSADVSPPHLPQKGGRWPDQSVLVGTPFDSLGHMVGQRQVLGDFTDQHFPAQGAGIQPTAELTNGHPHPHRQGPNSATQQLACRLSSATETSPHKETRRNSSHSYNIAQPVFYQTALGPTHPSCAQQASRSQIRFPPNLAITRQNGSAVCLQGAANCNLSCTLTLPHQLVRQGSCQPQHRPTQQHSVRHGNSAGCVLASRVSELKLEAEDPLQASSCASVQQQQFIAECFDPAEPSASSFAPPQQLCLLGTLKIEAEVSDGRPRGLLSPGADQVTSTVEGSPGVSVLDNVSLDFSSILEESLDQGSLSQASSRLTTPRLSAMIHGLPPSTNNMAIGDMSSLLTTLAEESKILAIMQ